MAEHNDLGKWGEEYAEDYLKRPATLSLNETGDMVVASVTLTSYARLLIAKRLCLLK